MTAEVLTFPAAAKPADLPLVAQADGALRLLKMIQEMLPTAAGIDRRRRGPRTIEALIGCAVSALERGITAHTADAQRELGTTLLHALGSRVTVGEINGARRMLATVLDALPDYGRPSPG